MQVLFLGLLLEIPVEHVTSFFFLDTFKNEC